MVYGQLLVLHKTDGGYYGTDIAEIARENNVSVTSMQVNFCRWRAIDKRFACLNYLGRRRPNYSLREFIPVLDELAKNILALPILYLHKINYKRKAENLPPISKSSFFKVLNDVGFSEASKPYVCRIGYYENCKFRKEKLDANRKVLFDIFSFKGLLNKKDLNIKDIYNKFDVASNWFIENYPGVNPYSFFEKVNPKMRFLWGLFLLLKEGETPDLEARVIFEMQALFLVDCAEILFEYFLSEDYEEGKSSDNFQDENSDASPEEIQSFIEDLSNCIREGRKKQREPMYKF
ncbi:MAG TPA: hypothetical protein VN368_00695 [Candidatus Methylomirabilis sp.]|nr:hypothetical protein [Candidatus Methylomirabilis sp.]